MPIVGGVIGFRAGGGGGDGAQVVTSLNVTLTTTALVVTLVDDSLVVTIETG